MSITDTLQDPSPCTDRCTCMNYRLLATASLLIDHFFQTSKTLREFLGAIYITILRSSFRVCSLFVSASVFLFEFAVGYNIYLRFVGL